MLMTAGWRCLTRSSQWMPSEFRVRLLRGCRSVCMISRTPAPGQSHGQLGSVVLVFQPLSWKRHPQIPRTLVGWSSHRLSVPCCVPLLFCINLSFQEQGGGGEEQMKGVIQEALSLTVHQHRSQALLSSHSLQVLAMVQWSFKRLLGGAPLPHLPPLLPTRHVQRLGQYYLVRTMWRLHKSLPAAVCIPQSVGQMLRWLHH